jgi:predicted aminopeptidase
MTVVPLPRSRSPARVEAFMKGLLTLAIVVLGCSGCLQMGYLVQAAYGQDEIGQRARPIEEVLKDPGVPARTRRLLALIPDVKAWGEKRGLEPTDSYRHFVDLRREACVWVVSASHPLRFELETWWFPIVGSVPYLGWFNRRDADRFASDLAERGLDVDVRGASAYSTLGWFDDPVLSTMIKPHEGVTAELVNVVLHESVHATHYVQSQSSFNESLADFVADKLSLEYLEERLGLDAWQRWAFEEAQARGEERAKRFHDTYKALEAVYASKRSDGEKLALKRQITEALRAELDFQRPINNATLAQSRTYHAGTPVFEKLYACVGGDWKDFWVAIRKVSSDSFAAPQEREVDAAVRKVFPRRCKAAKAAVSRYSSR